MSENTFEIDGEGGYTFDKAEEIAKNAFKENGLYLTIIDEETGEEFQLCSWCEELFPMSELTEKRNQTYCDRCVSAIKSHGERF